MDGVITTPFLMRKEIRNMLIRKREQMFLQFIQNEYKGNLLKKERKTLAMIERKLQKALDNKTELTNEDLDGIGEKIYNIIG